jgi:hypothetical protein
MASFAGLREVRRGGKLKAGLKKATEAVSVGAASMEVECWSNGVLEYLKRTGSRQV